MTTSTSYGGTELGTTTTLPSLQAVLLQQQVTQTATSWAILNTSFTEGETAISTSYGGTELGTTTTSPMPLGRLPLQVARRAIFSATARSM
jgi:hypothetical protein